MSQKKTRAAAKDAKPAVETAAAAPSEVSGAPVEGQQQEEQKQWSGNAYRPLFSCPAKGFEMGEDRRFKQMVFRFRENPGPEVTDKLKAAGYRYRGVEKSWTVAASAVAREEAVRLAREFKGEQVEVTR